MTATDSATETSCAGPSGVHHFGITDWQTYFNLALPIRLVAAAGQFPWRPTVLDAPCPFHRGRLVRDTHFAFVSLDSMTMMELQRLNPKGGQPRFYSDEDSWYADEAFAIERTLGLRWHLLLKEIVPGSENKTFEEQQAMLPEDYEVPSALAETAKSLLRAKKTGAYANGTRYACTSDRDIVGSRVCVGRFDRGGIHVNFRCDVHSSIVGIGASRKG
jgi:hypothetical protein